MAKETVREAFLEQARFCDHLGSPLTAQLMRALPEALEAGGPVAERVWTWPGQPDAKADSVPLRLGGVLHRLVRAGEVPALAALYPPSDLPGMEVLRPVLAEVLDSHSAHILDGLTFAPQTNEVGRASALYAGLLTIAAEYPQPFALYEVGASAGLNLMADRFGYRFGEAAFGDPASPVQLTPAWSGPVPPQAPVQSWVQSLLSSSSFASRRISFTCPPSAGSSQLSFTSRIKWRCWQTEVWIVRLVYHSTQRGLFLASRTTFSSAEALHKWRPWFHPNAQRSLQTSSPSQ